MLSTLALLACPIGMGLVMWMMMRGQNNPTRPADGPACHSQVQALRAEVEALKDDRGVQAPQHRTPVTAGDTSTWHGGRGPEVESCDQGQADKSTPINR